MPLAGLYGRCAQLFSQKGIGWEAKTHKRGISYYCSSNYAFMYVDIHQDFVSTKFFTGDTKIDGLKKGNWAEGGDNKGSETYRIYNEKIIERTLQFALEAHRIASNL